MSQGWTVPASFTITNLNRVEFSFIASEICPQSLLIQNQVVSLKPRSRVFFP